jgi:tetratricopeptide (TPR) repeat protein
VLGEVAIKCGDHPAARHYLEESLSLALATGNQVAQAAALNSLAASAHFEGRYLEAMRLWEQALAIATEINHGGLMAAAQSNLGEVTAQLGSYREAYAQKQEALAQARAAGDRQVIIRTLFDLALVILDLPDHSGPPAQTYLHEGLQIARQIGATPQILAGLCVQARLHVQAAAPVEAAELLGLVLAHPASESATKEQAQALLDRLTAVLPAPEWEAAMARGTATAWPDAVRAIVGD